MSVDAEETLVEVEHVLGRIVAIGLVLWYHYVELLVLGQRLHGLLEGIERDAETRYELERTGGGSLLYHGRLAVGIGDVQLICNSNVLVVFIFHYVIIVCVLFVDIRKPISKTKLVQKGGISKQNGWFSVVSTAFMTWRRRMRPINRQYVRRNKEKMPIFAWHNSVHDFYCNDYQ